MNHKKIHDLIIKRAKERTLEGYSEKHHIIPKCLGGTDDQDNLVHLTAREHFIIHKLLCEIYPNESKLHWAAFMMATARGKHMDNRDYRIGSREYERLRESLEISDETRRKSGIANIGNKYRLGKKHSDESKKKMSQAAMGNTNSRGYKHTEEARKNMSKAAKARDRKPHSGETKQKMSDAWKLKKEQGYESPMKGIKRPEEVKKKISASKTGVKRGKFSQEWLDNMSKSLKGKAKGKIWINNGVKGSMILPDEPIPEGWTRGMLRRKQN
tara:strand:+ start:38 stop:847 length:810 start_codon:yes stop_codon:yes gene_type:complete